MENFIRPISSESTKNVEELSVITLQDMISDYPNANDEEKLDIENKLIASCENDKTKSNLILIVQTNTGMTYMPGNPGHTNRLLVKAALGDEGAIAKLSDIK